MKKQTKNLYEHLMKLGWNEDTAKDTAKAYMKNSIKGIVKSSKWMNDKAHDYTHELTMDVAKWYLTTENLESSCKHKKN